MIPIDFQRATQYCVALFHNVMEVLLFVIFYGDVMFRYAAVFAYRCRSPDKCAVR